MEFTKAAVLNKELSRLEVKEIPIAPIDSDEILVQSKAATINSVDNYHIDYNWAPDNSVLGVAVSGVVLKVGQDVTRFKQGDYIASFIHDGDYSNPNKGAFSSFAVVQEIYSIRLDSLTLTDLPLLPFGEVNTFEGACSVPDATVTLAISLAFTMGGSFDKLQDKSFLIYGGSTATGLIASQIAKLFGWKVISIASKKHEELIKSLGADHLIDYHDLNVVEQVKAIDPDITIALHTVGDNSTIQLVHDIVSDKFPTKVDSLVIPNFENIANLKSNVTFSMTRAFIGNGKDVIYNNGSKFVSVPGIRETVLEFVPRIQKLINNKTIKHIPIKIQPGGLNEVNEGLSLVKEGKISGQKLVLRF